LCFALASSLTLTALSGRRLVHSYAAVTTSSMQGDIGSQNVLQALSVIAPITAVRGNNDKDSWAAVLPERELVQFGETFVYVIHELAQLDIEPQAAGVSVVVSGHSHQPLVQERNGVLYVNPGSAGPRRFKLPIAVGELNIVGTSVTSRIVELGGRSGG